MLIKRGTENYFVSFNGYVPVDQRYISCEFGSSVMDDWPLMLSRRRGRAVGDIFFDILSMSQHSKEWRKREGEQWVMFSQKKGIRQELKLV